MEGGLQRFINQGMGFCQGWVSAISPKWEKSLHCIMYAKSLFHISLSVAMLDFSVDNNELRLVIKS